MNLEQIAKLLAPYENHIRSLITERFNLTQELDEAIAKTKELEQRATIAEAELQRLKDAATVPTSTTESESHE